MKFKMIMLAALLLAILTIGAVSASENVTVDDNLTADAITEDVIEDSVDEVVSEPDW